MPNQNIICLAVDRLRAAALGAYGNTWFETRALDSLASESFVFDHYLIDSPQLPLLYRSYWQGRHALEADPTEGDSRSGIDVLRESGWMTALITDEPAAARLPLAESFEECRVSASGPASGGAVAEAINQTQMAQLFAEVATWIDTVGKNDENQPFLLWVHSRGMDGAWDAPVELRNSLVEEDEPAPPQDARVPREQLDENHDPDQLHGAACAYAGQVMALDACVGALMDLLREHSLLENTLVVLLGVRGFPLGEHRRLGDVDAALHAELVHVPLLVRMPDGCGAMGRSQSLIQPPDLLATLFDWLQMEAGQPSRFARSMLPLVRGEQEMLRDHVALLGDGAERALRTPAWYLRRPGSDDSRHVTPPRG